MPCFRGPALKCHLGTEILQVFIGWSLNTWLGVSAFSTCLGEKYGQVVRLGTWPRLRQSSPGVRVSGVEVSGRRGARLPSPGCTCPLPMWVLEEAVEKAPSPLSEHLLHPGSSLTSRPDGSSLGSQTGLHLGTGGALSPPQPGVILPGAGILRWTAWCVAVADRRRQRAPEEGGTQVL